MDNVQHVYEKPQGATPTLDQLVRQVERAARVQRSLLPDLSVPVGAFRLAALYHPCEPLGGDLYDLSRREDCAMVLVADAMGHGLEAALAAMIAKAAFQESASETCDPGELLARMNARLHRALPEGRFVAAAAARLDLLGGRVQVANAGLPCPFMLRACDARVEEVRVSGVPLALLPDRQAGHYDIVSLDFAAGDAILITSDGIGAVESGGGQCFEDGQLREVLTGLIGYDGRTLVERVMSAALEFGHGRPFPDDINMIAISRQTA